MKIFNFLPLNGDHRGAVYENDYLRVEESADVRGCVFFDCTFESKESFSRALRGGGICTDCTHSLHLPHGRSNVMYVNAENIISLEVGFSEDCGILGDGKYIIFSDSDLVLDEYTNLLPKINSRLLEEAEGFQKKTLDSRTFARIALSPDESVWINDPYSIIADSTKHESFGTLKSMYFNAYERIYTRDDGDDSYSAFLYIPPHDPKDVYIFGEDVRLDEFECYGGDIAETVKKLFPDKTELADRLHEDDEINTFKDATYTLDEYLNRSEIAFVRDTYLGVNGEPKFNFTLKTQIFETILDRTSGFSGQKVGVLLDKSLLILDRDKLNISPISKTRCTRNIKFVTV